MTTIADRIMMIKGVTNRTVHFGFRWPRILYAVGPAPVPALHKKLR